MGRVPPLDGKSTTTACLRAFLGRESFHRGAPSAPAPDEESFHQSTPSTSVCLPPAGKASTEKHLPPSEEDFLWNTPCSNTRLPPLRNTFSETCLPLPDKTFSEMRLPPSRMPSTGGEILHCSASSPDGEGFSHSTPSTSACLPPMEKAFSGTRQNKLSPKCAFPRRGRFSPKRAFLQQGRLSPGWNISTRVWGQLP